MRGNCVAWPKIQAEALFEPITRSETHVGSFHFYRCASRSITGQQWEPTAAEHFDLCVFAHRGAKGEESRAYASMGGIALLELSSSCFLRAAVQVPVRE